LKKDIIDLESEKRGREWEVKNYKSNSNNAIDNDEEI